jgi:hypothetical protein
MSFDQFLSEGLMGPSWANDERRRNDASLRSAASDASNDIRQLQQQVDKLRMVCRALCETLIDTTPLTEERLLDLIDEIDQRDGMRDGRMKEAPTKCSACERTIGIGRPRCQYCGADAIYDSPLDEMI